MTPKPVLTPADIDILKKFFATKQDQQQLAAKQDLQQFATKADLKQFASKQDIEKFATKEDLKQFSTKQDLVQFATKSDLTHGLEDLLAEIVDLITKQDYDQKLANHEQRLSKLENIVY